MVIVFLKLGIMVLFYYIVNILYDKYFLNKTITNAIKFIPNIAIAALWVTLNQIFKLNIIVSSIIIVSVKLFLVYITGYLKSI